MTSCPCQADRRIFEQSIATQSGKYRKQKTKYRKQSYYPRYPLRTQKKVKWVCKRKARGKSDIWPRSWWLKWHFPEAKEEAGYSKQAQRHETQRRDTELYSLGFSKAAPKRKKGQFKQRTREHKPVAVRIGEPEGPPRVSKQQQKGRNQSAGETEEREGGEEP